MKDTSKSVRDQLAKYPQPMACEDEWAMLRNYADLLERIEKSPVVKARGKVGDVATIAVSHDMVGKRVALVVVDE